MATIKDVARLAGVSVSTVSLVLNTEMNDHRVSSVTWMKVHNAMDTLNYRPNASARKLRKSEQEIPSIGVFWPEAHQLANLGNALVAIQNAFNSAYFNCNLNVYIYRPGELKNSRQLRETQLLNGIIIGSAAPEDLAWLEAEDIRIPLVLFNRQLSRYNFVRAHNREMGRKAAELLLAARCSHVAVIRAKAPGSAQVRRIEDFLKAFQEHQGICDEYLIENEMELDGVIRQTDQMIADGGHDAVVFLTEAFATYSAIYRLMRHNLRIPEDLKVLQVNLRFNNLEHFMSPALTMVSVSAPDMLRDCVNILLHQMKDKDALPIHKLYSPEVIYGETLTLH